MSHPQGEGAITMAVFRPEPALFRRQIDSIRQQSLNDWRCYIAIDGTDPQTLGLVQEVTISDPRFVVREFGAHVGFYRNFERVLAAVPNESPWVALADQDDYWYPHKLERLVAILANDPRATAVTGQARLVNELGVARGLTSRAPGPLGELLLNNSMTGSFMVVRAEVLGLALPFPEPTDVAYHDHWLGVCAAALGPLAVCHEPLQDYVQHGSNVIGESRREPLLTRWGRIPSGRGPLHRLAYLSRERWGWRVRMARALLERGDGRLADHRLVLDGFARGRLGFEVLRWVGRAVRHRALPRSRAMALVLGALLWPWVSVNRGRPGRAKR